MTWNFWANAEGANKLFIDETKNLSNISRLFCYSFIIGNILKDPHSEEIIIGYLKINKCEINFISLLVFTFIFIDFFQYLSSTLEAYLIRKNSLHMKTYNDLSSSIDYQDYNKNNDNSEKIFKIHGWPLILHNDIPIIIYLLKLVIALIMVLFLFILFLISFL